MYYARKLASVMSVGIYLVIETDEVAPHELRANGYEPAPSGMSADQVKAHYGVKDILRVTNAEMKVV